MIRLSTRELESDVMPQAIFWRPLVYFTTSFRENEDGLDKFRAVSFTIDNELSFDLRHYRGHPAHTVTAYFAFSMQEFEEIVAAIEIVVAALAIPAYALAWRRGWEFEFGSLTRQESDRLREPEARILALKIAARQPHHSTTTEYIKREVPNYYPLSEIDLQPSPSRKRERRWQQIVGNVVSHHKSLTSLFGMGYAERTDHGLSVTSSGLDYLNSIGFSV
jgi:hypothetical protein